MHTGSSATARLDFQPWRVAAGPKLTAAAPSGIVKTQGLVPKDSMRLRSRCPSSRSTMSNERLRGLMCSAMWFAFGPLGALS